MLYRQKDIFFAEKRAHCTSTWKYNSIEAIKLLWQSDLTHVSTLFLQQS